MRIDSAGNAVAERSGSSTRGGLASGPGGPSERAEALVAEARRQADALVGAS